MPGALLAVVNCALRPGVTSSDVDAAQPKPLGMPLQFMVTSTAVQRGHSYPEKAKDVNFNPVGQIVGRMNKVRPVREVIYSLVEECIEASERLARLMGTSESVS